MNNDIKYDLINIGSGYDLTIKELAIKIRDIVYPECEIKFNGNIDINGTPKKLLDISRISELGWSPKINIEEGIKLSSSDFLSRF